jgi:hypothetical protein
MAPAQVVTMRFDEGRQRPEDRCRVPVHIGERVKGSLPAGRPGALPTAHCAASSLPEMAGR